MTRDSSDLSDDEIQRMMAELEATAAEHNAARSSQSLPGLQTLYDLLTSEQADEHQRETGEASGVEVLWDDREDHYIYIGAAADAHVSGEYITASPETVVPVRR